MSSSSTPPPPLSLPPPPPPLAAPPPRFETRFEFADFFKNKREEVLFNLLVNPGQPLTGGGQQQPHDGHPMARPCETSHGPDFSGLLFEGSSIKSEDGEAAVATAATSAADDGLNGELIAFDQMDSDMARDSFTLFSSAGNHHCGDGIELEVCSPSGEGGGAGAAAAAVLNLNFPLNTFLAQHGSSFLAAAAAAAGIAPPPDGPEVGFDASPEVQPQSCCSNLVGDWSLPPETVLLPPHHAESNNASSSGSSSNAIHQYNLQQCDSCQILHCIIHSNGVQDTKLEIHGSDGQSYNAVLHTRFCVDDGFPTTLEQQIVEFPVGNAEYVKQFLLQYSLLRRKEGFVLRHDSTGSFDTGGAPGYGMGPECLSESSPSFPKQLGRSLFSDLHSGSDVSNAFSKHHLLGASKAHRTNSLDSSLDPSDTSNLPVKPPKSNAAAQVFHLLLLTQGGMTSPLEREQASSKCPISRSTSTCL